MKKIRKSKPYYTSSDFQLIPIEKTDFEHWQKFRHALYQPKPKNLDFFQQEMHKIYKNKDWFVGFINIKSQHVGFFELSARNVVDGCLSERVAYLEGLYIQPQWQRQGLGSQVVEALMDWSRQQGFTEFAVDTEWDNSGAQAFFKALGMQQTYKIVQYKAEL